MYSENNNIKFLETLKKEIQNFNEERRVKYLKNVLGYYDTSFGQEKFTYGLLLDEFAKLNTKLPKTADDFKVSKKTRKIYVEKLLALGSENSMMKVPPSMLDPDIKKETYKVPQPKGVGFVPRMKK